MTPGTPKRRTATEQRRRRWGVVGLAGLGSAMFAASYYLPYWNFHLVAPQYPKGLNIQIHLTGISGDLFEIDILNHYIGMKPLSEGALLEAAMSPYIVTVVVLAVMTGIIAAGKRIGAIGLLPALGLPVGFVLDTLYWMYRFGHELAEDQPINFEPFMPTLLGSGVIGQFHTTAWPGSGFWIAVLGGVCVGIAVMMRKSVCDHCPKGGTCGGSCGNLMVLGPKDEEPT